MSEEKIIYPEDVILELADVPIFKIKTDHGVYYTAIEQDARMAMATHRHCSNHDCKRPAHRGILYCKECWNLKRLAEREDAPLWDGSFPVTNENSDEWFFDIDELAEFCFDEDISPEDLFLRIGVAETASAIKVDYEELLGEDASELVVQAVQKYVDDFIKGLENFKDPLCWYRGNLVRLSDEKIAEINRNLLKVGE